MAIHRSAIGAFCLLALSVVLRSNGLQAQEPPAAAATKPTEHVLGTLTAVDGQAHTVTVKEDGTSASRLVQVGETRTILKVAPGAKDLKGAARITAADLAVGDRVDVRGFKNEADPTGVLARSVILMSGGDVQQAHQMEAAAWQRATTGNVIAVDPTNQKLTVSMRTPEGPKPVVVDTTGAAFTRFSPEQPQIPISSKLADIQTGDQVRFQSAAGSDPATGSARAEKVYSGTFKTTVGTVVSVGSNGKSLIVKDLQTKKPVNVALSDDSAVRKLPQMMAYMLARRFNPDFKGAAAGPSAMPGQNAPIGAGAPGGQNLAAGAPSGGPPPGMPNPVGASGPGGMPRMRPGANGDLSQMLERVPKISASDLKPGDAVVVSGSPASAGKETLLAHTVIAGVEPIFQSASPKQAQSLGDWGASLGGGAGIDAAGGGGPASGPPQ